MIVSNLDAAPSSVTTCYLKNSQQKFVGNHLSLMAFYLATTIHHLATIIDIRYILAF